MRITAAAGTISKSRWFKKLIREKWLYIFVLPGVLSFLIFCYAPMFGIIIAFQDFNPAKGFFGSRFVGLDNFRLIFGLPQFNDALRNSIVISLLKNIIGFPLGIAFALFLNEIYHDTFKKITQTITYLPYFISWVITAGIFYKLLSVDHGVVNDMLVSLHLVKEPIFFFGEKNYFYALAVFTDNWKGLGFGSIYYLASISGINPELYEAAIVDGAGRLRKMWHITLPGMRNMIVLFMILAASQLLNAGFDQMWTLGNPTIRTTSEILETLILRTFRDKGIIGIPIGAAMGLFCSFIGMILFLAADYTAKKFNENSLL